jgi:hypothetical protein
MNDAHQPGRVLIVGRSPSTLTGAVEILRAKGYSANATNQFDRVLEDYDVSTLDLVVFGGMVPPDMKEHLRDEITERNPGVTFIQGLSGIAGLIAAQVQAASSVGVEDDFTYDEVDRAVRVNLERPSRVAVEVWWATSWTPPEPKSTSMMVFDDQLDAGQHSIRMPDLVPWVASFGAVTIGSAVQVFTIGSMPDGVLRMVPGSAADTRLPDVGKVTTTTDER